MHNERWLHWYIEQGGFIHKESKFLYYCTIATVKEEVEMTLLSYMSKVSMGYVIGFSIYGCACMCVMDQKIVM